jgi:hypothetical protein
VSDSKKFGTRDPAHTGGPELPEVGPPPPGSASTFYVSGSVFEYLRWLEEIPGQMLPNRARAWTRLRDVWRSWDAPQRVDGDPRGVAGYGMYALPRAGIHELGCRLVFRDSGGFAKPLRGGAGDVGRHASANELLEKADESCWFFSRTSAASSFWTGCPYARARRTRTTNEGGNRRP